MEQSDGTLPTGNTKPVGRSSKSRTWFVTSFQDPLHHFENAVYEAWCSDTSKPEHGSKFHYHHVIHFKNPISFNTMKKAYPTAHFGPPKKDLWACVNYIKENKNGRKYDVGELGTLPVSHRFASIKEVKEMTVEQRDELGINYYNVVQKINTAPKKVKVGEWIKNVKVYYIWGPSGALKSTKAEEILVNEKYEDFEEVKHIDSFWHDVVDAQGACVYDDWRDSHMSASEFINFIDYRTHNMNIKGGSIRNNYKLIIITSVQDPEKIYKNLPDEPRKQWMRRMEIIHLEPQLTDDAC